MACVLFHVEIRYREICISLFNDLNRETEGKQKKSACTFGCLVHGCWELLISGQFSEIDFVHSPFLLSEMNGSRSANSSSGAGSGSSGEEGGKNGGLPNHSHPEISGSFPSGRGGGSESPDAGKEFCKPSDDGLAAAKSDGRPPSVRRKFRTLTFGRRYKTKANIKENIKKQSRKGPWNFKFSYRLKRAGGRASVSDIPEPSLGCDSCVCTSYRRTEEHHLGAGVVFQASTATEPRTVQPSPSSLGLMSWFQMPSMAERGLGATASSVQPTRSVACQFVSFDLSKFNSDDFPIEHYEERARAERALELEEGVDSPTGYRPASPTSRIENLQLSNLAAALQNRLALGARFVPRPDEHSDPALSTETHVISKFARVTSEGAVVQRTVHTQVDYIHCLVPDLLEITNCSFYWGKMDRYEAEKLLENKAEGTFLLRDSAQEEYLFSVSFRRYRRSLHARIEQWNHKFSFDSHDPGVFASETVCGLIEHYKDPTCCMFFEPMLTIPLHRTFTFPLQHLCRSVICKATSYDGVNQLSLPKCLKVYLKEYHYKQRVRVRRFEVEQ